MNYFCFLNKFQIMHKLLFIFCFAFVACNTKKQMKSEQVVDNYNINEKGIQYAGVFPNNVNRNEVFEHNPNRMVTYRDTKSAFYAMNRTNGNNGIVTIKVLVNRKGDIVYAEIIPEKTTIKSPNNLNDFLLAALKYRIEADNTAPEYQTSELSFKSDKN